MNDNINNYLRASFEDSLRNILFPSHPGGGNSENDATWVSIYRVFKVPYSTQLVQLGRFHCGQIGAVFCNANLPYPNIVYGFNSQPDGTVKPKGMLAGWDTTSPGILLLLTTPVESANENIAPEIAVRDRIDSARSIIVAILGLNAAFEQICEFIIEMNTMKISTRSPIIENPAVYDSPNIYDKDP